MRNIWRLFCYDIKHLFCNVITVVIVLGLVFLPSIFTWYNVIACWDVFGHTGNLKVAVANTDEGWQSDLVAVDINVGDTVVSTLRANDQLDWVFTSEDDAIDGARSGKYYAAVVIPESFSKDMFSFYTDDTSHAQIIYYTNEKKNAVAPRVTDQGADQVSAQINQAFTATLSDVVLALADSVGTYADESDAGGHISELSDTIAKAGTEMSSTADVLDAYQGLVGTAQQLVDSSSSLLTDAKNATAGTGDTVKAGKDSASSIADALKTSTDSLTSAIQASTDSFSGVSDSITQVYDSVGAVTSDTSGSLRTQANDVNEQIERYRNMVSTLEEFNSSLDELFQPALDTVISQLNTTIGSLEKLRDSLNTAADNVDQGQSDALANRDEVLQKASSARSDIDKLISDYDNNLKPGLENLSASVSSAVSQLSSRSEALDGVGDDLQGTASSISGKLSQAKDQIAAASSDLRASADKMNTLSNSINEALASGSTDQLKAVIGSDPEALATAISAPVGVERVAVFPVDNFGSAMAPLYTTLALWVGSLLLLVLLNPNVSERAQQQLVKPRSWQMFFGRYGVMLVVALTQATVLALGNAFFLKVQISDYFLFFVCFWVAGFVFSFIVYTLVSLFANLGKAIAVLFLIVQVTGGGGSFPLQLLPEFFQNISPFLPATHVISAMRAAMMGVYNNDFWVQICMELCFVVPCIVLGLMRPVFAKLITWYVEKVDESKLVS